MASVPRPHQVESGQHGVDRAVEIDVEDVPRLRGGLFTGAGASRYPGVGDDEIEWRGRANFRYPAHQSRGAHVYRLRKHCGAALAAGLRNRGQPLGIAPG